MLVAGPIELEAVSALQRLQSFKLLVTVSQVHIRYRVVALESSLTELWAEAQGTMCVRAQPRRAF